MAYMTRRSIAPPPMPYGRPHPPSSSDTDHSSSSSGPDDDDAWSTRKDSLIVKQEWVGKKGKVQKAARSKRTPPPRKRVGSSHRSQTISRGLRQGSSKKRRTKTMKDERDPAGGPVLYIDSKARGTQMKPTPCGPVAATLVSPSSQKVSGAAFQPTNVISSHAAEETYQVHPVTTNGKAPTHSPRSISSSPLSSESAYFTGETARPLTSSESNDVRRDERTTAVSIGQAIEPDGVVPLTEAVERADIDASVESTSSAPISVHEGHEAEEITWIWTGPDGWRRATSEEAASAQQQRQIHPDEKELLQQRWYLPEFSLQKYLADNPRQAAAMGEVLKTASPERCDDFLAICDEAWHKLNLPAPTVREVDSSVITVYSPHLDRSGSVTTPLGQSFMQVSHDDSSSKRIPTPVAPVHESILSNYKALHLGEALSRPRRYDDPIPRPSWDFEKGRRSMRIQDLLNPITC